MIRPHSGIFSRLMAGLVLSAAVAFPAAAAPQHAISLWGTPKYGPDFTHFDYVNPSAPKGGHLRMGSIGTFDSFHPFTMKGTAAAGVGHLYETLMTSSLDEPGSAYGLLAESIAVSEDGKTVTFTLRKEARFHDGTPVTPEDVVFSFTALTTKGTPHYRKYYADVANAEAVGNHGVRFTLTPDAATETAYILGQFPVLPAHIWKGRDFTRSTMEIPVGSGPYRIGTFVAGRSITLVRDPDYWGKDLAVNRGSYNFDRISWEYFRDHTVSLEAFKAGVVDFRTENTAKTWATLYTGPAFKNGSIKKERIHHQQPSGMQGFAFNIRKSKFKDPLVRKAIGLVFDFEWANKNLFYDQYQRTESYFQNSELAAKGLPDKGELALLTPFQDRLSPEVFGPAVVPPVNDGSGNIRPRIKAASALLTEAGWILKNGKRVHKKTGTPLSFEILLGSPSFRRIAMPFRKNLARLGIPVTINVVDRTRYIRQLQDFDFDMIVANYRQSDSPGSEQREMWGSDAASLPGSRNRIGITDPVVDALVDHILKAAKREDLITACHALDRVLRAGYYMVPQWHNSNYRIAYWNKLRRPSVSPDRGLGIYTWWVDTAAEKALTPDAVRPAVGMGTKP